ncbi:MAG: winged helix-turn-helix domain-containing protein [Methanobacterium sp.]|jgi:DNA-binding transcriptional ArsR family regulator|nr:winged helix-turn-helix domain-containing protein [Methanobacterium sp.]
MEDMLWWLIAGTRGGINRARIIKEIHNRPYNANQLSKMLNLDYKTIRHHMDVLKKNNIIKCSGEGQYGSVYMLSSVMKENYESFDKIWKELEK